MAARKYNVYGLMGAVTAYDSRDIAPLLEAARGCLPENDDLEDLGFREVPGSRLRALAAALAPLRSEES
jgi:hypothetical protein